MTENNPFNLAQKCSEAVHQNDHMAQSSGMKPISIGQGSATVTMTIKKQMLNGFGSCHGGMIFSLADTAFAHACNSRNETNVAMDCRIDFLYPAYEGDDLTARAEETHKGRNSSLYEITVQNQDKRNIAFIQGRSYRLNQSVIKE